MIELPDFDRLYADDRDPWQVGTSFYERRKQALVLGALSHDRYRWGWDTACGTGHLAAALALRCGRVTASDGSPVAAGIATRTCAGRANVRVETARLPLVWPDLRDEAGNAPDLVILAEYLYYLDGIQRSTTIDLIADLAAPGTEIVGIHWRHHPHDAFCSGHRIQCDLHRELTGRGWQPVVHLDDPEFVLDSWVRQR